MRNYTVLLDANVLYPAPMRDALMQLAITRLFKAKWTADIHREWIDALSRNEPHRDRAALERTRDLMDKNVRDGLITGYESLIPDDFFCNQLSLLPGLVCSALRKVRARLKKSPKTAEVKWSGKFGQRAKMYSTRLNGYKNDKATEFFRQV